MKIKVSKVFADFINKTAKEANVNLYARVLSVSQSTYKACCGDVFDAEEYGDYDWETGKVRAIVITYPEADYANPRYVSTRELTMNFRRYGVKNVDGLKAMVLDMFEI